jgi:hypothetical protein
MFRGDANKVIAFDLHVSQKTVETHGARLMRKLEAESFADLIRCYVMAFGLEGHVPPIRRASRGVSSGLARAAGGRTNSRVRDYVVTRFRLRGSNARGVPRVATARHASARHRPPTARLMFFSDLAVAPIALALRCFVLGMVTAILG